MIEFSSLPPAAPHGPVRPATLVGGPGAFALPHAPAAGKAGGDAILLPVRQILAGAGKPVPTPDAESGDEDVADGADIAFAWFALPVAPPAVQTPSLAIAPQGSMPTAARESSKLGDPGTEPVSVVAEAFAAKGPDSDAVPDAESPPREIDAGVRADPKAMRSDALVQQLPTAQQPQATGEFMAPSVQSAATVFAAALETHAPSRRSAGLEALAVGVATVAAENGRPHAVSTAADVQQGALDMRRQEWMGQMVERIEALRDAAPVRETRLSLVPEALGKVDVSIRQEGDRIHVHFAAETQAARQLITDAQPRLSELAEARGVKLGQTSVDGGGTGQGASRQAHEGAPIPPRAPRPAEAPVAPTDSTNDRIA